MLCAENNAESKIAISNILSKVQTKNAAFYRSLYAEHQNMTIAKELNSIIERINNHSLEEDQALERVYAMYVSNPDHERLCSNLAQLAAICIMKYIVNDHDNSRSVKKIINDIINNKSDEFRNQSVVFRKAYNKIWDQLPVNVRLLLSDPVGISFSGEYLNSQGRALKTGLDLMKKLGDISSKDAFRLGVDGTVLDRYDNLPF